ncbi:MAG: hypothetical protein WCT37_01155 [Patescibacteria group bacterium]|jgi:hypothetical protein
MPVCKNCQKEFIVSDFETKFLDRISPVFGEQKYQIPAPVFCPECRLRWRTIHRNEQYLYQNVSAKSGKNIISLYSPEAVCSQGLSLYSPEEWWQDDWDGLSYGRDFDFNRPFFSQFNELARSVPRLALMISNCQNSDYTTDTGYCKNCYLINYSENDEDCYYGKLIQSSRDIMDSDFVYKSELCYGCFNITECYHCLYLSYGLHCHDCYFSENLHGCSDCLFCTNLVNQECCVRNKKVTPEEFAKAKEEVLGSRSKVAAAVKILDEWRRARIHKYAAVVKCQNSTGDFLTNCKNCAGCYDCNDSEDCQHVVVGVNVKDLLDCSNMYLKQELGYQVLGTIDIYNVIFSLYVFYSQQIIYSESVWSCKNLFGCSGLRNKEYCIFNKQYTEEEYNRLVPKIILHMQKTGEWGNYFPAEYSPFPYNNTVAHDYLPLTKEEATKFGGAWLEVSPKEKLPPTAVLPDKISEVPDDITKEVFACAECGRNYKIIKQELVRLRQLAMPVSDKCFYCRQAERMQKRNPRRLYDRKCDKCGAEIKTTYPPERPEKIYCEECYRKEIY